MWLGTLAVPGHVPGTMRYFDDPGRPQTIATADSWALKCDRSSGPVPILLPSDDPNNFLNWPLWQRHLVTFILSLTAIFAPALGPILAANTSTQSVWFSLDFTHIALVTGYYLLSAGGKRHLFIVELGVGTLPFDDLVNAVVGDLYCMHQGGKHMVFAKLAVFGGVLYRLFCPETAYGRHASLNTDIVRFASLDDHRGGGQQKMAVGRQGTTGIPRPRTVQSKKLVFCPLPLFAQPAFLWTAPTQGTMIGWTAFIGASLAAPFLDPPVLWDKFQTGYAYTDPFVGALLVTGLFGFVVTAQGTLEGRFHWVVPVVFFGFAVADTVIGAIASSLHIIDEYRKWPLSLFSFGLMFKAYGWLVYSGIKEVFLILGAVQIAVRFLTVLMYIFGKRNWNFFHRHDLSEKSGLR
ncbi:major facilitator superfamily transporter [Nemania serpens]|nr:major facilitator superfamily transporter [Nemania serpens]